MKIKTFQYQGSRNYQQDTFYTNEEKGIFLVCDGVGGSQDGGKASEIVSNTISEYLLSIKEVISANDLRIAIQKAQNQLSIYRIKNPEFNNSGTTVALLILRSDIAFTAHLGDSKVILLKHNSDKIWHTKDHSMVQELFDAGVLKDEEDMHTHPLKNRITNGLFANRGSQDLSIPINELNNISTGDVFIICSDGVLESYRPIELFNLFKENPLCEATDLVENRVKSISKDNSTFILVQA